MTVTKHGVMCKGFEVEALLLISFNGRLIQAWALLKRVGSCDFFVLLMHYPRSSIFDFYHFWILSQHTPEFNFFIQVIFAVYKYVYRRLESLFLTNQRRLRDGRGVIQNYRLSILHHVLIDVVVDKLKKLYLYWLKGIMLWHNIHCLKNLLTGLRIPP